MFLIGMNKIAMTLVGDQVFKGVKKRLFGNNNKKQKSKSESFVNDIQNFTISICKAYLVGYICTVSENVISHIARVLYGIQESEKCNPYIKFPLIFITNSITVWYIQSEVRQSLRNAKLFD